jgi:membrane-bound lytic murein transglycosylase B
MPLLIRLTLVLVLAGVQSLHAAGEYKDHPEAKKLIDELVNETGADRATLTALLAGAERKPRILEAIARPAEKKLSWAEYRPRFLEEKRIETGLAFWEQHEAALNRANATYGVPPEIVLAIIGVETWYGRNKGSWRIVDALSTLAFDFPRRSEFFRAELKHFIKLGEHAHIKLDEAVGSYAGAMGFPQFMPSSYRNYAIDFDNDGITDLINNPVDAIGSVANYFRVHGWRTGAPVAARARVTGDAYAGVANQGLDAKFTVAQIRAAGLTVMSCIDDSVIPVEFCADPADTDSATAWQQTGARGAEFWVGFRNFYVITRYNRSDKYALAVLQLSSELRHARQVASRGYVR